MNNYANQRAMATYLTTLVVIWWNLIMIETMVGSAEANCYYSSYREEYSCWVSHNWDIWWIAGLTTTLGIPFFYALFYYPQVKFIEWKNSLGVVKEVEVVKEVFREPLPIPPPLPQQQGIVIKNYQVKDGVVTEE